MAELRSFIFLDQLQPQTMCYLGTWIRGRLPRAGMAAAFIEVAPGLDIEPLTDVAIKHTRLEPGILVVERQFGYLEFHSSSPAAVRSASGAVLEALGASPRDATKPAILAFNEAEKAAGIKVVDYRMIGATGRVYITGEESDVRAASDAATAALEA